MSKMNDEDQIPSFGQVKNSVDTYYIVVGCVEIQFFSHVVQCKIYRFLPIDSYDDVIYPER